MEHLLITCSQKELRGQRRVRVAKQQVWVYVSATELCPFNDTYISSGRHILYRLSSRMLYLLSEVRISLDSRSILAVCLCPVGQFGFSGHESSFGFVALLCVARNSCQDASSSTRGSSLCQDQDPKNPHASASHSEASNSWSAILAITESEPFGSSSMLKSEDQPC